MTHRERFRAIFEYRPVDRIPVYYFGTWAETRARWKAEGFAELPAHTTGSCGPQIPGMDPNWEDGLWDCQGMVLHTGAIGDVTHELVEDKPDYRIYRNSRGDVVHEGKLGRMLRFYKDRGVPLALVDSDGNVEKLVPLWLDAGFDIIFPIEVGTWKASVADYRRQYGRRMRMFGGMDKLLIPRGAATIRAHLLELKPVVDDGGYIPIPDHRIPPECSYQDFLTYLRVFGEVFGGG